MKILPSSVYLKILCILKIRVSLAIYLARIENCEDVSVWFRFVQKATKLIGFEGSVVYGRNICCNPIHINSPKLVRTPDK
jgi:hypothetical protein